MILLPYSGMLHALPGGRQFLLADKMIRQEFKLDRSGGVHGNSYHAVTLHNAVFEPSTPFNHVATYLSLITDMAQCSSVGMDLAAREEYKFKEKASEDNNSNTSLHISQEEEEVMVQ
eukprot:8243212-Ditylum_brightwellii.AAC.1